MIKTGIKSFNELKTQMRYSKKCNKMFLMRWKLMKIKMLHKKNKRVQITMISAMGHILGANHNVE